MGQIVSVELVLASKGNAVFYTSWDAFHAKSGVSRDVSSNRWERFVL